MTTPVDPPRKGSLPAGRPSVQARRSVWMLPLFALAWAVAAALGNWFLSLLGLHEGDLLLMAHRTAGWVAEITVTAVLIAAPLAGVGFAVAAIRAGAGRQAKVWLALNGALAIWVIFLFADNVRLSYFPGG